mmetsp:Transcript_45722/g.109027  ORF Transcript_45722/g.109027 Transcript_45722/m.109027 type:complete len:360 (+) Transcript_45722:181-1260(+)
MLKALTDGAFQLGYGLYKTKIGQSFHERTCAETRDGPPHSSSILVPIVPGCHVTIVPILHDNYAFLIVDEDSCTCLAVDPADCDSVLAAIDKERLSLAGVLCTHTHWDHSGGNEELARKVPGLKIYGSAVDAVPGLTDPVTEGEMFWFPPRSVTPHPRLAIQVWEAPCHTKGHLLFLLHHTSGDGGAETSAAAAGAGLPPVALFSGDTLFAGGVGKFFEGTAEQMDNNLSRIGTLPPAAKVFCGHEYTVTNYKFAAALEPDNQQVSARLSWAMRLRVDSLPTVPSTLSDEMDTNPYMRVVTSRAACGKVCLLMHKITGEEALQHGTAGGSTVLGALRRLRDSGTMQDKMEDAGAIHEKQ